MRSRPPGGRRPALIYSSHLVAAFLLAARSDVPAPAKSSGRTYMVPAVGLDAVLRKTSIRSMGMGKMIVLFLSPAIWVRVCR